MIENNDLKNVIYNLRVPKSNEILNEIIKSVRLYNAKEEIKKLEKKLDDLVYKIYGLSNEEIKIVEKSWKHYNINFQFFPFLDCFNPHLGL